MTGHSIREGPTSGFCNASACGEARPGGASRGPTRPNEGTIRKRADGRLEARVLVTEPDGRRVRRSLLGRTPTQVRDKLREALRAEATGRPPSALFRTPSDSTRLLVAPLAQRLAEAPCHPARDRLLNGSEDVGWETRGLRDRALQVDPVARR
jgi:hypothetical protein